MRDSIIRDILAVVVFSILCLIFPGSSAFAQQTTDSDELRAVIEDLRSGSPDFDNMEPPLRIALRERKTDIDQFFRAMGSIESITFEETDQGVDIYLVQFRYGRTVFQFARSPRGRIAILYFQLI